MPKKGEVTFSLTFSEAEYRELEEGADLAVAKSVAEFARASALANARGLHLRKSVAGPRFRSKSVLVYAMQLPAEGENASQELIDWLHSRFLANCLESGMDGSLMIHTPDGTLTAEPRDWIIEDARGELSFCKPESFAANYEAIADDLDSEEG